MISDLLSAAILAAIGLEIFLEWRWQKEAKSWHQEARRWHQEEMAQWQIENGKEVMKQ